MHSFRRLLLVLIAFLFAAPAFSADGPIAGLGPKGEVTELHDGYMFTEGPAVDAQGNVYFTDVRANRIHKVDLDGKISTFLEDSQGCNGLMFDRRGRLVACQGGAKRIVAIDVATKQVTVLADKFEGKPFNRPNDLVVDRHDGVYFTDPDSTSVYYAAADGRVSRVATDLPRPNGVLLSPDEATLYVLPSGTPDVMAYPVTSPGVLGAGRVFCRLEQAAEGRPRGGDGLTVDSRGNLYFTQPALRALQVVSPEGKTLGLIRVPKNPSNCTFGGKDLTTLFITAQTSLYTAPMEVKGHRFAAERP
jgi:gluconolactonase